MQSVVFLLALIAVAWCNPTDLETKAFCNETVGNDQDPEAMTLTYESMTYRFVRKPMNFVNAEMYCRRLGRGGGHLASIHSVRLDNLLLHLANRCDYRTSSVWIGGMRFLKSRYYIWTDGSKWNYSRWVPGEPNNLLWREACTEMYIAHHHPGQWNDNVCSRKRPFICEY